MAKLAEYIITLSTDGTVETKRLVRCKDCKHRPAIKLHLEDALDFPDGKCPGQQGLYSWIPGDDWFCADGEPINTASQQLEEAQNKTEHEETNPAGDSWGKLMGKCAEGIANLPRLPMYEDIREFSREAPRDTIKRINKAYKDILNGVKEQATIPYDMKWNPDCEDCRPEDIRECTLCRQR